MEIEPEQNQTGNQSPAKSKSKFPFVLFVVIVPVIFILLFIFGLIVTNSPISLVGWIATTAGILFIWTGWFLLFNKINRDLNDPEVNRLSEEQEKLFPFLNRRTFEIKKGEEWRFQGPEGKVLAAASKYQVLALSALGALTWFTFNISSFSFETQQNIVLVGAYVVIIAFGILMVRAQKRK